MEEKNYSLLKSIAVIFALSLSVFITSCGGSDSSDDPAADTTAPEVVSITPVNGATGVDPATDKIIIEFNEPMRNGYSIGGSGKAFPVLITSNPVWTTPTKIEITLKTLSPITEYEVVLNKPGYSNFQDEEGNPLETFTYTFTTGK